jgi:hypothetical protein
MLLEQLSVQVRRRDPRELDPEDLVSQVTDAPLSRITDHLEVIPGVLLRDLHLGEISGHHLYVAGVHQVGDTT